MPASAAAEPAPPPSIKLVSWNVASLPSLQAFVEHQHGSMARFLDSLACDIFCVQVSRHTRARFSRGKTRRLHPSSFVPSVTSTPPHTQ